MQFARSNGLKFFETSANDNTNITEAFQAMAILLASKVTEVTNEGRVRVASICQPAVCLPGQPVHKKYLGYQVKLSIG